jgi:hypothetical protein
MRADEAFPADNVPGVAGDTVTLDFGTTPVQAKTFTFAAPGAVIGQRVQMSASGDMPAGVALDELEMDSLQVTAAVSGTDLITALVVASPGPVTGLRAYNYTLG